MEKNVGEVERPGVVAEEENVQHVGYPEKGDVHGGGGDGGEEGITDGGKTEAACDERVGRDERRVVEDDEAEAERGCIEEEGEEKGGDDAEKDMAETGWSAGGRHGEADGSIRCRSRRFGDWEGEDVERRRFVGEAERGSEWNGPGNGGVEGRIVAKEGGKAGEELRMGEESAESPGSGESPVGNTGGDVVEYEGGIRRSGGDEVGETTSTGDGKGIREIVGGVGHDGGFGAPAVEIFPVERGEGRDGGEVVEARSVGGESGKGPMAGTHLEREAEGHALVHVTPAPVTGNGRGGGNGGFHAKAASDGMDGIGKG